MFSTFANIFVMFAFSALHTFSGDQYFLCRNTYGSHFWLIREVYFHHSWANGLPEHDLQEQQVHFLAEKKRERKKKAEEVPLMATSQWDSRHGQPETQGLASFKSPDKTGKPSFPSKAPGDTSYVSGSLYYRFLSEVTKG